MLVNRPLLSCCHFVYSFLDVNDNAIVDIPAKVLSELGMIATLMFATAVDLRADWAPFVWATDGAQSFGYGGTCAACDPATVKHLASFVHIDGHQFVPTDIFDSEDVENPAAVEMPLRYADFRRRFSQQSKSKFHASKLEAGTFAIAIRNVARQSKHHRKRCLFLVDAKALMFAVKKWRSPAANFIHSLREVAALALAADLRLHVGYIESTHNPGDPPSRWKFNQANTCKQSSARSRSSKGSNHFHILKRSVRHLHKCGTLRRRRVCPSWSSTCSSSLLAQPPLQW